MSYGLITSITSARNVVMKAHIASAAIKESCLLRGLSQIVSGLELIPLQKYFKKNNNNDSTGTKSTFGSATDTKDLMYLQNIKKKICINVTTQPPTVIACQPQDGLTGQSTFQELVRERRPEKINLVNYNTF
ncbi:hypothetical protein E3U43_016206 [Larimichthys crocea]|uniref:Uncharacterized protein n=1 Tax=Larimichthys crocea TaxID=215358 RepID=A0ACD3QH32_LARCR|nr:hypothetical protein E3U43_016206 [Larimichthys crocea]